MLAYQLSTFKVSVLAFTTVKAFLKNFRKPATYKVCQSNLSKQSEIVGLREEREKVILFSYNVLVK